jgi:hypothetical protein
MESRQLERLHGSFEARINRVLSGESPSFHIVSGEVPLRTQAMEWYSTAVQLSAAQLCTVARSRPLSAALKEDNVGFLVFATSEVAAVGEKEHRKIEKHVLGFVGRHATVSTGMASHPIGLAGVEEKRNHAC